MNTGKTAALFALILKTLPLWVFVIFTLSSAGPQRGNKQSQYHQLPVEWVGITTPSLALDTSLRRPKCVKPAVGFHSGSLIASLKLAVHSWAESSLTILYGSRRLTHLASLQLHNDPRQHLWWLCVSLLCVCRRMIEEGSKRGKALVEKRQLFMEMSECSARRSACFSLRSSNGAGGVLSMWLLPLVSARVLECAPCSCRHVKFCSQGADKMINLPLLLFFLW